MNHVVLLGDSIFDNRAYVAPLPDVTYQLRTRLGDDWKVTLLAADGHVTADVVARQLGRVPKNAAHLVISVGGNDALRRAVLGERVDSVAEALGLLGEAQSSFAAIYTKMIEAVLRLRLPTAVCTIYDANYPEPQRRLVVAALALFNDVITRAAFAHRLPLIDLRLICCRPTDYANPIEPSAEGGDKIATVIAAMLHGEGSARQPSPIWT